MAITIENNEPKQEKKSSKNWIMLMLSLALGGGGVFLANDFIDDKIAYYKSQFEKTEPMIKVVVPVADMVRGQRITQNDLSLREVPVQFAHANAVTNANFDVAVGQHLSFDIASGKPLLWAHLEGGLSPTFSGSLVNGLRAMTVPVDEVNSISGFLQPSDNIDLFMTYKKTVFPVIQNLHVLATGTKTITDKTGRATGTYQTITVQVTPEIAKKIVLARSIAPITATLRNPKDEASISASAYTVAQLLNIPKPVKKRRLPRKKGIEFIIGGV
jgi:pilus assembly protein CpaB